MTLLACAAGLRRRLFAPRNVVKVNHVRASVTAGGLAFPDSTRQWLTGRRVLVLTGAALAVPALWLGWPWLLAAGLAPLLLSLAPCLVMCGLGLCAMRGCSRQEQSSLESVPGGSASVTSRPTI